MDHGNKAVVAIVTLVLGLAVGGGIGYASASSMNMNDDSSSNSNTSMNNQDGGDGVTVGGAKMVKDKDIVDNASQAKNVSTLVSAVQAADLVETLKGDGPFTVFGPNNDAFAALPEGTLDDLLKPENKAQLQGILTYHVVPGTYTAADLKVMAQKGEKLKTVQGGELTPVLEDNMVKIQDAKGNKVNIETTDVISSNGVTHVIEGVLMQ